MAKQQLINRTKYKDIKRYDHNQMEQFARSLYESGLKDGAAQAIAKTESSKKQMDFDLLTEKLLSIKGIGAVKAEQIVSVVKEVMENE
ncbi:hypothetical protein [Butyribacter intestini]|jgi:endonuclease III-like uncharacterized protein|uniref:Uncharacterized protein n=1 Tax=Butyribacter intestini TaxID=1703332 RepID=A0AAW3JTP2_9FIRM|nr:hypothetical protein [Butyribacter intestini]KQC86077.1 hypothetical protein APZ18_02460 [Butyribacter intestini]RHU77182.1 hypothetical protein DXC30_02500 [Butyribacter intestini]